MCLQVMRAQRELDSLQQQLTAAEVTAEGLREALESCQARHAQQLARWVLVFVQLGY